MSQERQGHEGGLREEILARARGALAAIEAARPRLDDLNVFPVPDGDTGTNMALSVRAIVDALERSDAVEREALAREIARAALLGARGNSGVILSQIVRGAAESFAHSDDVARALRRASDVAYAQVGTPVEGTMLTAIRELAAAAEAGGDVDAILARGDACVVQTRALLPAAREAGVVDAGAAGLVELVRGFAGRGAAAPVPATPVAVAAHEPSRYRFCTSFVVEGRSLDAAGLERELEPLGDSLLVVGADTALRVHVHTDEPERAVAIGRARGEVELVEIADMHEQIAARDERLAHRILAVVDGAGNRRLFESLGATVVDAVPAAHDGMIVVTELARSLPAALSALVAYDPHRSFEENLEAMRAAAAAVADGSVGRGGDGWRGVADGELVANGASFDDAALAVAARLLAEPRSVLTLLAGAGAPPLDRVVEALAAAHPDVEVEPHDGGQSACALLIGAE